MNIFLIGFMGSGKSTLGKQLADYMAYTFIETDSWIEQQEGKSINQVFSENGEDYFRKKESEFLLQAQLLNECVIATGGGMPCCIDNIGLMNRLGVTVWLDVDENILLDRLEKERDLRPLLADSQDLSDKIHELLEVRNPFYGQAKCHIKNPTIEKIVAVVAKLIMDQK